MQSPHPLGALTCQKRAVVCRVFPQVGLLGKGRYGFIGVGWLTGNPPTAWHGPARPTACGGCANRRQGGAGSDRGRLGTTLSFWLGALSLVSYVLRTQTNTVSSLPCFLWRPCSLPPVSQVGKKEKKVKSLSHVRLSDPMDCSLPGSSTRGIFQARALEWVAISFSRGYSRFDTRDRTWVSRIAGRCFTS